MNFLRVVFFGTPDFAASSLKKLLEEKKNVVAVVTSPDRPSGRGKKVLPSAVKEVALSAQLPILQPTNLKSPLFYGELMSYHPDLQIVVAFRMLPEVIWNLPIKGTFNLHASLLPNYRGAAPINWAIMNGEEKTGITTFFLQHEIDTGDIIFQKEVAIAAEDNFGTLYKTLQEEGKELVLKTLNAIEKEERIGLQTQKKYSRHRLAPKIFSNDCFIDWNLNSEHIHNFIRGLSPYPCAKTFLKDKMIKIFSSTIVYDKHGKAGEVFFNDNTTFGFYTQDGALEINELQLQGRKRMDTISFLKGYTH